MPLAQSRTSVRRLGVVGLLVLGMGSGSSGVAGASPSVAGASPSEPPPVEIAHAMDLRERFGLRADEWYVRLVASDPAAFSDDLMGIPLDSQEAAEIERRIELQDVLTPAREHALTLDDYGGTWMDQAAGGLPVFAFTGDLEDHARDLASVLPEGTRFDLRQVRYTMAQLDTAQDQVNAAAPGLRAAGIPVVLTGLDDQTNTVVVGVEGLTPDMEAGLRARFGDIISVRDEGP